jgi:hypothetical protein
MRCPPPATALTFVTAKSATTGTLEIGTAALNGVNALITSGKTIITNTTT